MKILVHIISIVIIATLTAMVIQGRLETRQAKEESFKNGVYFGVKSLRILVEKKEDNITWDKLYAMALMAQMDEKPIYEPLNAPMGK